MRNYALLNSTLQDELGSPSGFLTSEISIDAANRLWLSNSFFKKLKDVVGASADERCLALFRESNARCASFVLSPQTTFEDMVIGEVKTFFDSITFSGPDLLFGLAECCEGFMVGPGASVGCKSYNFYTKLFDSDLTCTEPRLYRLFWKAIRNDPRWFCADEARNSCHGVRIVAGNRLSFVPKTTDISRSICTEPNLNMLFQKGIGSYLELQLKRRFRIDLSKQPELNRRLAQRGSIDGTFGTIDLSSASDSMSLNLLRELMPPELFWWLELARSPRVTFPNNTSDELHMVSSMGNAFTFPLQTILFSTLVTSCYRILGIKPEYDAEGPTNFAVFGDDIIVRKDAYEFVVHCLGLFGFSVNVSKSFNTGEFRESCGGDFFRGCDIRGVYLSSLLHDTDVYSAINRLIRWSSRTGIMIPKTVSLLLSWLPKKKFFVPRLDGDSEGLKVPYPPSSLKIDPFTGGVKYTALCTKARSFRLPSDPDVQLRYPRLKGKRSNILFNPDGVIVTVLAGFTRNGRVGLRSESYKPKVQRRVTSSWSGVSYPPDAPAFLEKSLRLDQGVFSFLVGDFIRDSASAGSISRGTEWELCADDYLSKVID